MKETNENIRETFFLNDEKEEKRKISGQRKIEQKVVSVTKMTVRSTLSCKITNAVVEVEESHLR